MRSEEDSGVGGHAKHWRQYFTAYLKCRYLGTGICRSAKDHQLGMADFHSALHFVEAHSKISTVLIIESDKIMLSADRIH